MSLCNKYVIYPIRILKTQLACTGACRYSDMEYECFLTWETGLKNIMMANKDGLTSTKKSVFLLPKMLSHQINNTENKWTWCNKLLPPDAHIQFISFIMAISSSLERNHECSTLDHCLYYRLVELCNIIQSYFIKLLIHNSVFR